ncbi:MAG: hypothetical protein JW896_05720 [Deltaproteobacteria bacterium]|nr:hypothetical protein [Deltaproteobacteria bacterium]
MSSAGTPLTPVSHRIGGFRYAETANAELSLRSQFLVVAAGGSNQSFEIDWLLALRS